MKDESDRGKERVREREKKERAEQTKRRDGAQRVEARARDEVGGEMIHE